MPTYDAYVTYAAVGGETSFAFSFGYIDPSHVKLYVNGTEDLSATVTGTPASGGSISPSGVIAANDEIIVRRFTSPSIRLVDYQTPSILDEATLDTDSLQAFYLGQEANDRAKLAEVIAEATTADVAAAQQASESARDAAQTAQGLAEGARDAAAGSASAASGSVTTAAGHATSAQEWANRPHGSLVPASAGGDEIDDYSARHWSVEAAAAAAGVNLPSVGLADAGKALVVNETGTGFVADIVGLKPVLVSTDVTIAEVGTRYIADTSLASFTITLPLSPQNGDRIGFADAGSSFQTNNLIIARNDALVVGVAEDLICDLNRATFTLEYISGDWRLI